MSPAPTSQAAAPALAKLSGTILLVGAGKMGSAMLEGWLALGLAADKVAVLEPQPAPEITAQDWAIESMRQSMLAAEPSGVPSS